MAVQSSTNSEKTRKPKAPPKPKVISEEKLLENTVKEVFFQPTSRRQPFLYRGFISDQELYTVGSSEEKDLVFANPNQSMGIIRLTCPVKKARIDRWLAAFGITESSLDIVHLSGMASVSAKAKWDMSKIKTREETLGDGVYVYGEVADAPETATVVVHRMESLFTLNVIAEMRQHLIAMLEDQSDCFVKPYVPEDQDSNVVKLSIPYREFSKSPIGNSFPSDIEGILTKGVDLFDIRSLVKNQISYDQSLVFKIISGNALVYGSLLKTPAFEEIISRIHVFFLPCKTRRT